MEGTNSPAATCVALTGHAEVGREVRGVAALGAGRGPAAVPPHAAPAHVLVAEARLAAQARVLPQPVARLACANTNTQPCFSSVRTRRF